MIFNIRRVSRISVEKYFLLFGKNRNISLCLKKGNHKYYVPLPQLPVHYEDTRSKCTASIASGHAEIATTLTPTDPNTIITGLTNKIIKFN